MINREGPGHEKIGYVYQTVSFYAQEGSDTAEHLQISPVLTSGVTCIKPGELSEHCKKKIGNSHCWRAKLFCSDWY